MSDSSGSSGDSVIDASLRRFTRLQRGLNRALNGCSGLNGCKEGSSDEWPSEQLIYARLATLPQLGDAPTICEIGASRGLTFAT